MEENKLYIDKSLFVKQLVRIVKGKAAEVQENQCDEKGTAKKVQVFTRPKRFGKTMALSLIEHFFAKVVDRDLTAPLFQNYAASFAVTKDKAFMRRHQGKYMVIKLDLKSLKGYSSIDNFRKRLVNIISDEYEKFQRLLYPENNQQVSYLDIVNKQKFNAIKAGNVEETRVIDLLKWLTRFITQHNERAYDRTDLKIYRTQQAVAFLSSCEKLSLEKTFHLTYAEEEKTYLFYGSDAKGQLINGEIKDIEALTCLMSELPLDPGELSNKATREHVHRLILWALNYAAYYPRPIVLIDEFDSALNELRNNQSFWGEARNLMQKFFEEALKSNDANFEFAVITGITSIAGGKLFSGWNNININTLFDTQFNELFGFTEAELKQLLADQGQSELYDNLRNRFGFIFCGDRPLINPWCVAKALGQQTDGLNDLTKDFLHAPEDANLIRDMLIYKTPEDMKLKEKIRMLLANQYLKASILSEINFMKMNNEKLKRFSNETWFLSLAVHCGYLTRLPYDDNKQKAVDEKLDEQAETLISIDNNRLVMIPNFAGYRFFWHFLYPDKKIPEKAFKKRDLILKMLTQTTSQSAALSSLQVLLSEASNNDEIQACIEEGLVTTQDMLEQSNSGIVTQMHDIQSLIKYHQSMPQVPKVQLPLANSHKRPPITELTLPHENIECLCKALMKTNNQTMQQLIDKFDKLYQQAIKTADHINKKILSNIVNSPVDKQHQKIKLFKNTLTSHILSTHNHFANYKVELKQCGAFNTNVITLIDAVMEILRPFDDLREIIEWEQTQQKNAACEKERQENLQKEENLVTQQQELVTAKVANGFKGLLNKVAGLSDVGIGIPARKIFISYAWPKDGDPKKDWLQAFLATLQGHLQAAGLTATNPQSASQKICMMFYS